MEPTVGQRLVITVIAILAFIAGVEVIQLVNGYNIVDIEIISVLFRASAELFGIFLICLGYQLLPSINKSQ